MSTFSRRGLLQGAAWLVAAASLSRSGVGSGYAVELPPPADLPPGVTVPIRLVAAERPTDLPCFADVTLPMWTFSESDWLPVIRIGLGDRLDVSLDNHLPRDGEHTSIHWHGVRLPNDQDGVPYLVQPPVMPGESFRYSFLPPDTGTFFFHPHCNTAEQMGRGLAGVLIVDGDTIEPYAADVPILLRDWLIDFDGGVFRNFFTTRGASRAGTFGNVRSANGAVEPEIRLPSSGDCRLRLVNSDPTRVMEIALLDAEAAVIAIDGIAVAPFPLEGWLLGPGGRLDLVIRAPADHAVATLVDQRLSDVVPLARLIGWGPDRPATPFDPRPLRAGRIAEPRLADAERLPFVFARAADYGAAPIIDDPLAAAALGSLCLSSNDFWRINGRAWPGSDHAQIPAPLAVLARGRSYVFSLKNGSQLLHPIHIHGHTFKVLRSDRRSLPVHYADTVVLTPDETIDVAFVADNPGKWMFHCHIIEHQETGMMGYVEVA
jgi:FtsP/CotA-like multicopper oxidase with cupredoxin domain